MKIGEMKKDSNENRWNEKKSQKKIGEMKKDSNENKWNEKRVKWK